MDLGARLRCEREPFLRKLNGETESEITEDNLDPIIRNLRVSLASVEHHAKEAFEKTQRDITTLRQIQKLAATLRWPESRKVGATVSRLTDSSIEELERAAATFAGAKEQLSPDRRSRRSEVVGISARSLVDLLQKHGVKDPIRWTAGIIYAYGGLELPRLEESVKKEIESRSFWELNFARGGSGFYLRDYVRRLLKN